MKQTKQEFKNPIRNTVNDTALKFFQELQQGHSKTKNIKYDKLQIQPYIDSPTFTVSIPTL